MRSLTENADRSQAAFAKSPAVAQAAGYLYPPWHIPPPGHQPFSRADVIALPAAPSVETVVLSSGQQPFTVPIGWDGVIKYVSCSTNAGGFVNGSGSIIWKIRRNQNQYVRNYDNIQVQLGVSPFPGDVDALMIYSQDVIQWTVTNVSQAGGASQVMCFFRGWFWPRVQ